MKFFIAALVVLLSCVSALAQYQPPPVLAFPLPNPPIQFGVGDIQLLTNAINQIANSAVIGPFTPGHLISGGPGITQIQDSGKTPGQVSALAPLNSAGTLGDLIVVGPGTSQIQDGGGKVFPSGNILGFTPAPVFNVSDYGAVGNGSTDDTTAISAALTACGTAGGGFVVLGAHQYLVASGNLTIPTNCRLGGQAWIGDEIISALHTGTSKPAILLNPTFTVKLSDSSSLEKVAIFPQGFTPVNNATPRTSIATVAGWTGTAITPIGQSTMVRDVYVVGFNTCYAHLHSNGANQRPNIDHFRGDCTNGIHIQTAQDVGVMHDIEMWPFYTQNSSALPVTYTITNVTNSSGSIQLTTSATTILQTGDVIGISGVGGFTGANGRQTVASASGTTVTLTTSAAPTPTGTWTSGSTQITVSSLSGLALGQTIAGANIPGGATIVAIDGQASVVIISAATTGSGAGTSLTITNGAYTSGGTVDYDALRNGVAFLIEDSQGMELSNLFVEGWTTAYQVNGLNANGNSYWTKFIDASCEAPGMQAVTDVCMDLTGAGGGKPVMGVDWIGGYESHYATPLYAAGANNANTAAQNRVHGVSLGITVLTDFVVSHQTGSLELVDVDVNASPGPTTNYWDISDNISQLTLLGCTCGVSNLVFNTITGQQATFNDPTSRFASTSSLGAGQTRISLFTATGTYKPLSNAKIERAFVQGGGGGGGGGSQVTSGTAASGGGGGGGGGCTDKTYRTSDIGSSLTVTVGTGGGGGAGAAGASSPGTSGSPGNSSQFGSAFAFGGLGGGGQGGANAAAAGGGGGGNGGGNGGIGANGSTATGGTGANGGTFAGAGSNGSAGAANSSTGGTGGGGSTAAGAASAGGNAGGVLTCSGASGGGSGGGITSGPASVNGAAGGQSQMAGSATSAGGTAGTPNGGSTTPALPYVSGPGGGGGYGNSAGNGGNGGLGVQGGGGGGGGSVLNGSTPGNGNNGGNGFVMVIESF